MSTVGGETLTGYLAPDGLLAPLVAEIHDQVAVHGRLVLARGAPQRTAWAQNVWRDVQTVKIASIGDAVRHLKGIQRNWWPYAHELHRRTHLIQEQLPHVGAKPIEFPTLPPAAPLGSFMLTEQDTMLAAPDCSSPFPNGVPAFAEYTVGPPSRAYLKLWEALTRVRTWPGPGDTCIDLGACPGGWTWVLARLGASVTAYDRSELDTGVLAMPGVKGVIGDAFQATPDRVGPVDWLVSDVICYPQRQLEHVKLWVDSGLCKNFVCTVKFQGDEHYGVIPEFQKIPGSHLFHSYHNKHELTWVKLSGK